MEYKDYYKILGVERDASDDQIKRAYRKLARKYHPDVSTEAGADDKFKEANEAYEVLKDPEKRAAYDQIDPSRASQQGFQPPPGWGHGAGFQHGGFTGGSTTDFSDFFESLFGQGFAGGRGPQGHAGRHGEDQVANVELDLEDAFSGGSRTVTLRTAQTDGFGRTAQRERTLKVTIPKGIRAGQRLRLGGQGAPGAGAGAAGDLYLDVTFKPHPYFRLDGDDLVLDLPVAPWEAALGTTVKAPTPAGPVDLKIPENSGGGRRLRLKGRGMPGKPPGDLYAVLRIVLPPGADDEARALYRRMAKQMPFNPRERLGV